MSIEISKFIEFVIAAFTNYVTGFELDRNGVPLLFLKTGTAFRFFFIYNSNPAMSSF